MRVFRLRGSLWATGYGGDQASLDLTFRNNGDSSLIIKDVVSSCGCMLLDKEQYRGEIVAPGADCAIRLRLDVGVNPGTKTRIVTLTTDQGGSHKASIEYNVLGTWSLSADSLDFGTVVIDQPNITESRHVLFESATDRLIDVDAKQSPWLTVGRVPKDNGAVDLISRSNRRGYRRGSAVHTSRSRRTMRPSLPRSFSRACGACIRWFLSGNT